MDNKYNGWTNYATWRVNLEWMDVLDVDSFPQDLSGMADALKDYVESYIDDEVEDTFAKSYAFAFLSDVNWYEIAEHLLDERA